MTDPGGGSGIEPPGIPDAGPPVRWRRCAVDGATAPAGSRTRRPGLRCRSVGPAARRPRPRRPPTAFRDRPDGCRRPPFGRCRPRRRPTEATLAIPLDTRGLVGQALDLLTRSDSGLRRPSFYIGFVMLVTLAPLVALFVLAVLVPGERPARPGVRKRHSGPARPATGNLGLAGLADPRRDPGDARLRRRDDRGPGPRHRGHRRPRGGAAAAPGRVDLARPEAVLARPRRADADRVHHRPRHVDRLRGRARGHGPGRADQLRRAAPARPPARRARRLRPGRDHAGRNRGVRVDPALVRPRALAQAARRRRDAVRARLAAHRACSGLSAGLDASAASSSGPGSPRPSRSHSSCRSRPRSCSRSARSSSWSR